MDNIWSQRLTYTYKNTHIHVHIRSEGPCTDYVGHQTPPSLSRGQVVLTKAQAVSSPVSFHLLLRPIAAKSARERTRDIGGQITHVMFIEKPRTGLDCALMCILE